jgi:hypothetical protein
MRKVEWANMDSRIEIIVDGEEVTVTTVYERDTYLTDMATVTMSRNQFALVLFQATAAMQDDRWDRTSPLTGMVY